MKFEGKNSKRPSRSLSLPVGVVVCMKDTSAGSKVVLILPEKVPEGIAGRLGDEDRVSAEGRLV